MAVFVAAFGKHPGWNDHIDDLGIETPRLVEVKRRLYVEGIGGNIDSGAWDRLEAAQQVPDFNHIFVWRRPGDVVVGRMWSSQDGKGRAKYPMIVCVQVVGAPVQWALDQALPRLEELEAQCKAATDAAGVRAAVDLARTALRGRLGRQPPSGAELRVSDRTWAELADCPAMGPQRVGVHRVLYQIERELGDYKAIGQASATRSRAAPANPQHLRVPACAGSPEGEAMLWLRAMLSQLAATTEVALVIPLGREWVDVLVGPPDGPQFFCLRASPKAVPLVTDIPYTLDADFLARAEKSIDAGRSATDRAIALGQTEVVTRPGLLARLTGWAKPRTGLLIGLVGGTAAILAGVGLTVRGCMGDGTFPVSAPAHVASTAPPSDAPADAGWDTAPWRELVATHREWFGSFVRRLDDPPSVAPPGAVFQTRRLMYETDPTLAALLTRLDAAKSGGPIDPLGIAGVPRGDLISLELNPPDSVRTGAAQVGRTLAAARGFRDALGGSWPMIVTIRSTADSFESRGWGEPVEFLRHVVANAVPVAGLDPAPGVDMALVVARLAESINEELAGMKRHAATLESVDDPILRSYSAWAEASVGDAAGPGLMGLIAMNKAALAGERLGGRLVTFLGDGWAGVDQEAFAGSRVLTEFVGSPTADTFERWLMQAAQHPSLDPSLNPVRSWHAPQRLAEIDGILGTLSSEFGRQPEAAERERLDRLRAGIASIAKESWNRANEQRIRSIAGELERDLDQAWQGLTARLERARAERVGSAAEAKDRLRSRERVIAASPALNAAWAAWRDQLISQTPDSDYASMLTQAGDLEATLVEFSAGSSETLSPGASSGWALALADAAGMEREERVSAALRPLLSRVPEPAEVRRSLGAAAIEHAAWLKEAEALATHLRAIEACLAGAYTLHEPGPEGRTLSGAAEAAGASPLLQTEPIAGAVAPLLGRVKAVQAAQAETSTAALSRLILAEGVEHSAALAAWRKLGSHGQWPLTLADLAAERATSSVVARIADSCSDEARSALLREEVIGERIARWEWCFARQRDSASVEAAAAMMGDFGVTHEAIAEPRLRYNAMLAEFRGRCVGDFADPDAAAAAAQFVIDARGVGTLAASPPASALIADLEVLASGREPPVPSIDVTTLGPGSVGWKGVAEGGRVRFTHGGVTLEFIRVEPAEGVPDAVYLCTGEMSVAAAAMVLSTTEAADRFAALTTGAERPGVRTWMVTEAGFSQSSAWMKFPTGTEDEYPMVAEAGLPSPNHPIQRLSPAAALFLARSLGCRLPGPAEWRAALAATGGAEPITAWNLRDARWQQWQDAAAALAQAAKVPTWPDIEVFWPAGFAKGPLSGGAGRAAHAGDDGFVLFSPVSGGPERPVRHLIGNVSEFLIEGLDQNLDPTDPAGIQRALRDRPGSVMVVGGSALSEPSIPVGEPQSVDGFDVEDGVGFSDTGFRLVFDGKGAAPPRLSVAARVVQLIDASGYLGPD